METPGFGSLERTLGFLRAFIETMARFHFGGLTLDGDARQLLRETTEVHLSPKAFDLLKLLVENRPRALSKAELHGHLWPETFVSDANLATLVKEIRIALGDDAGHPEFVRTAHRFGYAFSGTATEIRDAASARDATSLCWLVKDGRRISLQEGENILGREPENGVPVDSPTVSRRHARIVIGAGDAMVEDLGSKNGTFLRGEQVSASVRLTDGDEIRVGSVVLIFRMQSAGGSTMTETSDG